MTRLRLVSTDPGTQTAVSEPFLPLVAERYHYAPQPATNGRERPRSSNHLQLELFTGILSRRRNDSVSWTEDESNIVALSIYAFNNSDERRTFVARLGELTQFGNYISRRKLPALRYSFASLTARHESLDGITTKLREDGFLLVGDVVQLHATDIIRMTGATSQEINTLVDLLAAHGLQLGSRCPGWSESDRRR